MCYVVYVGNEISWFARTEKDADDWISKQYEPERFRKVKKVYPTFVKALECFKRNR